MNLFVEDDKIRLEQIKECLKVIQDECFSLIDNQQKARILQVTILAWRDIKLIQRSQGYDT